MSGPFNARDFWKRFKAIIILVIAAFAFAVLGLIPQFNVISSGGAAVVNGQVISISEYQRAVDMIQRQAGSNFSGLPAAQRRMFDQMMRQRAMTQLVQSELSSQLAEQYGFYPSNNEVAQSIVDNQVFHTDGRFDRLQYERVLQANRFNVKQYEKLVKDQLAVEEIQTFFEDAMTAPKLAEQNLGELSQTQMNFEYVSFSTEDLAKMEKYKQQLIDEVIATRKDDLQASYDQRKSEFTKKEAVRARHILIKAASEKEADVKKAFEKAKKIRSEVSDSNFAELAKTHSEDPGSKGNGGDLGFFERGQMVREFETAAFSQKVGEVSQPIKSNFGYHIIKVEEKREEDVLPLEAVQSQLAQDLLKEESADKRKQELEAALGEGQAKQVNAILAEAGLKWTETGLFDLSSPRIPKLGQEEALVVEALSVQPGELVKKLILNKGKYYVVRLKALKESKDEVAPARVDSLAFSAFQSWFESERASAEITQNQALIQGNIQ